MICIFLPPVEVVMLYGGKRRLSYVKSKIISTKKNSHAVICIHVFQDFLEILKRTLQNF